MSLTANTLFRERGRRLSMSIAAALYAATAAIPSVAQEQEEHGGPDHHHGLHFSHPLITESVSPDTKVRLDFAQAWELDANESEVEIEVEYAFDRSFSVEIAAPYEFVNPEAGSNVSNVGSAEIALKFANFAFEDVGLLLGYGVEVGLPTGSDVDGIGSGHIWELEPFFNVGYMHEKWEFVGFSRFGIPTNQDDGEEIETEFAYDLSALYHVSPRLQGLVELNGHLGLSGDEAGEGIAALAPGIKFAPLARRPLFVGLSVILPIDNAELDAGTRISFFYHF